MPALRGRQRVEPIGLIGGSEAAVEACRRGIALPLAGGPAAFTLVRLHPGDKLCHAVDVPTPWRAALAAVAAARPAWAGLPEDRTAVMGVLNVTPDSFSDGGLHDDPVAAGRAMAEAGADIIDIGGESTRPGSAPVTPAEECRRILPVLRGLGRLRLSVDTRNASTMAAVLDAGAAIVNDVSALRHDPAAAMLLAASDCAVVLMHMRGDPATMDRFARYGDVALEVMAELEERLEAAEAAGIARARIALDPGFGFAKTGVQNLELLRRLPLLLGLGCRLVAGVSRKRFIGVFGGGPGGEPDPRRRGPGSLAAGLAAAARGASVLRVHDVAETVQALRLREAIEGGGGMA